MLTYFSRFSCWLHIIPTKFRLNFVVNNVFGINKNYSIIKSTSFAMSHWQKEKEKFLNMDVAAKRKFYKKPPKRINEIPTWREYASNGNLAQILPVLPSVKTDASKDKQLSSKVSLFTGDITLLEVSLTMKKVCSNALVADRLYRECSKFFAVRRRRSWWSHSSYSRRKFSRRMQNFKWLQCWRSKDNWWL